MNFLWKISLTLLLFRHNATAMLGPDEIDHLNAIFDVLGHQELEQLKNMMTFFGQDKLDRISTIFTDPAACAFIDVDVHCNDPKIAMECSNNCTQGDKAIEGDQDLPGVRGLTGSDGPTAPPGPTGVTDDGGWTIIQRRQEVDPRENFERPWEDYVRGFGSVQREYWMGLNAMHKMTSAAEHELYILLEDWEGNTKYASYKVFQVGSAQTNYKLTISGYVGDAGDSMTPRGSLSNNGQAFSTTDNDNNSHRYSGGNCAQSRGGGGWWYPNCGYSYLNGRPLKKAEGARWKGIIWFQWLGSDYSLRGVTMKIRPVT